ncbi:glycoside hydrolase family 3 protein [Treponema brennaborense]|uniref:beta-N-acetylhexosaminidase n=1 Tax=Treponema brennaborense (strain DSM 12168 / CIP 105900 / DD5/3) TaxID=906968 RepID=F4LL43_TREBD|nr:glycoside hydrolase family 3 protein [Treponema brennaborense]AEE17617.1 glycoside hydrolase family 3 domain protein [Treponema brennaborense DSM 12168]
MAKLQIVRGRAGRGRFLGSAARTAAAVFLSVCFSFFAGAQAPSAQSAAAPIEAALPERITFWSDYPADVLADTLVSRMSDEELLAQIFMFGWAGQEPSELLNRWVVERGLGSVKVFGWNTDNTTLVAESVVSLQQKSQQRRFQIPLFVATDQEGGWIRHVKGETSDTPGNLAIGASGYAADAWFSGYYISRELRALGINMNFAPTVDLYTNHDSSVIGPRSFGEDGDSVGVLGAAFTAGSLAAGVIPTAKHFPGHGDTGVDSHGNLPVISIDLDTLLNRELVPFKYLIAEKIPAIMSGHLSFPQIVPNGEPASLSKVFLTDILRTKLGYEGLIITDDMMMNGATMYAGNLSSAFRMAIEAGNDIIISSTTAQLNEALWRSNLELMKTSAAFKARVADAARRVIHAKLVYFKSGTAVPLYPDVSKIAESIPDPDGADFFLSQACRSISVFKGGSVPYAPAAGERILLAGQKQFPSFFSEAKLRYPDAKFVQFNYAMGPNETEWMSDYLAGFAKDFDTVIICVADAASAAVAERLRQLDVKTIVISVLAPFPAMKCDWADTVLLAYSYSPYSFAAVFGLLAGEFSARGTLPLSP